MEWMADTHSNARWLPRVATRVHGVAVLLLLSIPVAVLADETQETNHWAFQPLVQPALPPPDTARRARSPVDLLIGQRLTDAGLAFNPEADRRALARRVYLDLIGLPPTAEELAAFAREPSPAAYEQLVDRLLASPEHGERWARHWLDVVHFAETHGHDQDRPRENAWPYRDYVIRSFNQDKPYGRFVAEQIAADSLFPNEPLELPALGLLAAGPWDESSLRDIREDTLDRQIARYLDRDDIVTTVMSTFTSTTVHCARCHAHKFDPIPQADYYALQAVFAGTEKAEKLYDLAPTTNVQRQQLLRRKIALDTRDEALIGRYVTPELEEQLRQWEQSLAGQDPRWTVLTPVAVRSDAGTEFQMQPDGSVLATGPRPEKDTYTISVTTRLAQVTAVRLELLADPSLPKGGPGRQDNGNLHLSEIRLAASRGGQDGELRAVKLQAPSADFSQKDWEIGHALDGNPGTAWGIFPEVGKSHVGVFECGEDLGSEGETRLEFQLQQLHGGSHTIGRFRCSATDHPRPVRISAVPTHLAATLAKPRGERTPSEQWEVVLHFLREQVDAEWNQLPPPQRVYAGTHLFPADGAHKPTGTARAVHRLERGEITLQREAARPGALGCVPGLSSRFSLDDLADEAARRAALARWLIDPNNVLTWRSIVNRVWHHHFGRGIVDTPNDFGQMGSTPSHPALLDWLAIRFRDRGGSLKDLHRWLVTSETYRQSSQFRAEAAAIDADNRLRWRMPRTRLDAETVRDSLLLLSQRLDRRMEGPSVKQFAMSPGVHVTPKVDYAAFDLNSADAHRRSIYRFLFRTLPDPWMDALDCPAGNQLVPVRTESVTALQALAMLNGAWIVRQCEWIAARIEKEQAATPDRVRLAFRIVLAREPSEDELADFTQHVQQHSLASACRVLVNSNEFLHVN